MDTRDLYKLVRAFEEEDEDIICLHDSVAIELSENFAIETGVVDFIDEGIVLQLDEDSIEYLDFHGYLLEDMELSVVNEAEYQGRTVPLGKPMKGDVKKSKVYVRKPNGKVVKVNFGDKNMRIKKNSPGHRKSFRARHHCENPGPRWKARYWSCRAW
jgi:hypothetical protein